MNTDAQLHRALTILYLTAGHALLVLWLFALAGCASQPSAVSRQPSAPPAPPVPAQGALAHVASQAAVLPAKTNLTWQWRNIAGCRRVIWFSSTNLTTPPGQWQPAGWVIDTNRVTIPATKPREFFIFQAVPDACAVRWGPGVPHPPDLF